MGNGQCHNNTSGVMTTRHDTPNVTTQVLYNITGRPANASNALKEETANNFVNSTFDGCTKMFSTDQILVGS